MSENALVEFDSTREQHVELAKEANKAFGKIESDQQYMGAGEFLVRIKQARRQWASMIKPVIQAAYESHRKVIGLQKEVDRPLERAETEIIKPAMVRFAQEKEAALKAEEDRINKQLQDAADKKAKEEQERLEKAVKEKAEEDAKNAILSPSGDPIIKEPPPPPPPPPAPIVPKIVLPREDNPQGISYYDTYVPEVSDLFELVKAVVAGAVPLEAIKVNQSFLNQRARILKEHMQWPGVKVHVVSNVRAANRPPDDTSWRT